jgi:hypothetical protein
MIVIRRASPRSGAIHPMASGQFFITVSTWHAMSLVTALDWDKKAAKSIVIAVWRAARAKICTTYVMEWQPWNRVVRLILGDRSGLGNGPL